MGLYSLKKKDLKMQVKVCQDFLIINIKKKMQQKRKNFLKILI